MGNARKLGKNIGVLVIAAMSLFMMPSVACGQITDAPITFTISINDNGAGVYTPGDFAIYASDITSDGNGGIAGYSVNVGAAHNAPFTLTNVSPELTYQVGSTTTTLGFTSRRIPPPLPPDQGVLPDDDLTGYQSLGTTAAPVYGLGQASGDLESLVPSGGQILGQEIQPLFNATILIAIGTYTSSPPGFGYGEGSGTYVFQNSSTMTIVGAPWNSITQTLVPEPSIITMLSLFSGVLILRRRRKPASN
jgi:hypothetical protein